MNETGAQDSGAWAQWTNWGFGLNQATNHNHNIECPRCLRHCYRCEYEKERYKICLRKQYAMEGIKCNLTIRDKVEINVLTVILA